MVAADNVGSRRTRVLGALLCFGAALAPGAVQALDTSALQAIAGDDARAREKAIAAAVAAGDAQAAPALQALLDGNLLAGGGRVVIERGQELIDPLTGAAVTAARDQLEKVSINNRLRRSLGRSLAALALFAPEAEVRLKAAQQLQTSADEEVRASIERALAQEKDARVKEVLRSTAAALALAAPDPARRIAAVQELAHAPGNRSKRLLSMRLAAGADGEKDPAVRTAIERAIASMDATLRLAEVIGWILGGLSLGSILLLAALGLAITFGLMGVINMAHGELLMIGAYATYAVQAFFRAHLPGAVGWYLLAALPVSFAAAALVGVLLERTVVRALYGRPLETLLATWGASLLLIQIVRTVFGAQNVEVANPAWMSGGVEVMPGLVLPYNRIVILLFSIAVLAAVSLLLTRTRLGLLVRAVTQNRTMASGLGVATPRVDRLAFALGSGIAGLGGCALSQIGNVGPELGQGFIVDSFMVVVLGGVGQLAGTVLAALGLAQVNKLLEPWAGAVMAKIAVLVFVIVFIQRRPQGLFAPGGRASEEA